MIIQIYLIFTLILYILGIIFRITRMIKAKSINEKRFEFYTIVFLLILTVMNILSLYELKSF